MAHPFARLGDLRARHPAHTARMMCGAELPALPSDGRGTAEARQRQQRRLRHALRCVKLYVVEHRLMLRRFKRASSM